MTDQPLIPVLIYHSVTSAAGEAYRPYAMDPGKFAEQMEHVAASGFQTLTVSALASALVNPGTPLPEKPLLITFDDGFEEVATVVLPILDRLHLQATAYIVTAELGGRSVWLGSLGEGERPILSPGQIRELDAAGVEIGSHGHHHVPLDELSAADAAREIEHSGKLLADVVSHPIATFAYPYGYHSAGVKRQVRASGYSAACAVKQAFSHPGDDPFAIGRAIVDSRSSMDVFDEWIHGRGLPVSWRGERLVTKVWRAGRRAKTIRRRRAGVGL